MNLPAIDSELTLKATPPRISKSFLFRQKLSLGSPRLKSCGLVAIEAPAGFGKTSLLAQWRREALSRGAIAAWLTLDERDTPDRLIRGLRMATVLACGTSPSAVVLKQLLTPGQSATEAATNWLSDTAALACELVLFLDDVHALPQESSQQLLAYIALNAPANLTMILASRLALDSVVLGMASPRVNTVVVNASDLRLTSCESEQLLHLQVAPKLDPGLAARLHELSGGWPLGLQLIVSSLRGSSSLRTAVDSISFESGDIARYFRQCLDDRLSPDLMKFLLQISITDFVSPDLCTLLTERADAPEVLEHLCIVTPLFGESMTRNWLRMHSLGLDFLREHALRALPHSEMNRLNLVASRWFADNDMPEPAARHALQAGSAEIAFDLAERCLPDLLALGDFSRLFEWLERVPPEEILKRPAIATSAIWARAVFNDRDGKVDTLIESVMTSDTIPASAKSNAAAAMLYSCEVNDHPEQGEAQLEKWAAQLDGEQVLLERMRSLYCLLPNLYSGRPALARHLCERQMKSFDGKEFFMLRSSLVGILGYTYLWEGRVGLAVELVEPFAEAARGQFGRRSISSTTVDVMLAVAMWEQGEVAAVSALLADRTDIFERLASFRLVTFGHLVMARLAMHEHNESRALQLLDNLFVIGQMREIAPMRWEALAEQVRIHACASRGKTCASIMERLEVIGRSPEARRRRVANALLDLRLNIARAYTCIARQDFPAALPYLAEAAGGASTLQTGREGVTVQLLLALCKSRIGEEHEEVLAEAVSLADSLGLKRIIQEAHPALPALVAALRGISSEASMAEAGIAAEAPAATRDHAIKIMPSSLLTPKEREVLKHLAEGSANKRIANILDVSDETVKWHVKNLSAKLGGANRKHVVDRARQMGIIA
jgi:LuxR family maltose regulon positive regulatory protein